MPIRSVSSELWWDPALVGSVESSQRWVISAMRAHGPPLIRMLWRILGNEHDVCDAYQDTFVRLAYERSPARPRDVKAFLFRTASNSAISMLRRKKVHAKACRSIAERPAVQGRGIDDDLDAPYLQNALREQIARLPERLQSVVVLKDLAELSYPKVAKIMGISLAPARVYRCRAIRLLSAWMAKLGRE